MALMDLVGLIGALKRSKTILIAWIVFSVLNMALNIYRLISEPEKDVMTLGHGYGYEALKRGSKVFVKKIISTSLFQLSRLSILLTPNIYLSHLSLSSC